jgi:hypothetical protein
MANFTGQFISQSYQRILQIDGGAIQDGLGNSVDTVTNSSTFNSFTSSYYIDSASIVTEFGGLAEADEQTIELDTINNVIRLKDTITAPVSGTRTFEGNIEITGSLGVTGSINGLNLGIGAGNIGSNVAIGISALYSNTTGQNNVALGQDALQYNTTGNHNIAQGYRSLFANTSGSNNVALGQSALLSNTTGNQNIALGNAALAANTTGNYNIALGVNALYSNSTGTNNVALGQFSLEQNTSGSHNIAQGYKALYSNTTGSFNVGLGYNVQSGDFSGSVILGAEAEATANGQLALGSTTYPLGPVVSAVSASSTHTLAINLNGNSYRLLMIQ